MHNFSYLKIQTKINVKPIMNLNLSWVFLIPKKNMNVNINKIDKKNLIENFLNNHVNSPHENKESKNL